MRPTGALRESVAARTTRRGDFRVPGDRVLLDGESCQRGAMCVSWEASAEVTRLYPVVLVHGGTAQGTMWLDTPDGRPGWAQRLVDEGGERAFVASVVFVGETSPHAGCAPDLVRFLPTGAAADLIHLPEPGIHVNGHGLIYEKNSDEALQPVLSWLAAVLGR